MAGVKEFISNNLSFFKGWAVYLPFLILVLCNFLDQYYFTYEGAAAMKSYTLSMPVYWIVVGIGTCISAIMSSIIKKHLADGNQEAMNKSASNALVYTVVFSLIVSALVFLGVLPLVYSYTETDVGDNIFDFLSPIMALNFALALNMVMTGMLAVLGETKKYVTCLVVTLVAELTVDPFFIFFCKMGHGKRSRNRLLSVDLRYPGTLLDPGEEDPAQDLVAPGQPQSCRFPPGRQGHRLLHGPRGLPAGR